MIPILFEPKTINFDTNGIGRLSDAVNCVVTEERNGSYELELKYPMRGVWYQEIKVASIIFAEPGPKKTPQPFSVYRISRPINGIVTVYAQHCSYQMSYIPCTPFSAGTVAGALEGLRQNAATECPFTFWTDKTSLGNFTLAVPSSIRSILGGVNGSILDIYGGEYEFDLFTVKLHENRGIDSGVTLRYGKNITDLQQEENILNTVTGIYPYWADSDGNLVELSEKVISCDKVENFPYLRAVPVDFSQRFESKPTENELRTVAEEYVKANDIGVPAVNITVSFEALWQSDEYKEIAPLETLGLCDIVTVEYAKLGVQAKAKVIKTVYNVLKEKYEKIEIGEAKSTLADTIVAQNKQLQETPTKGFLEAAVQNATNWITGVNGGYVVLHKNAEGQPYEILVMDTPDIAAAEKVWRFNQNGWGYSKTGYNGTYEIAATMDGGIVADFITAGTMLANRISGGTLSLGGKDNGSGVCSVLDGNGVEVLRLDSDGISLISPTGTYQNIRIYYDYNSDGTLNDKCKTVVNANGFQSFYQGAQGITSGDCTGSGIGMTQWNGSDLDNPGAGTGIWHINYLGEATFKSVSVSGSLLVSGTKNRAVETKNHGTVLQNAYETAEPYFGDIGFGKVGEHGQTIVYIDPVFAETVNLERYMVFLQAEGYGELYVKEKTKSYFIVSGRAGTEFAYEIKAKQKGFEDVRLEVME